MLALPEAVPPSVVEACALDPVEPFKCPMTSAPSVPVVFLPVKGVTMTPRSTRELSWLRDAVRVALLATGGDPVADLPGFLPALRQPFDARRPNRQSSHVRA